MHQEFHIEPASYLRPQGEALVGKSSFRETVTINALIGDNQVGYHVVDDNWTEESLSIVAQLREAVVGESVVGEILHWGGSG